MKKILLITAVITLIFALFLLPCAAEPQEDTEVASPDTSEGLEHLSESERTNFVDKVIGIVTNGEIWAKIGVTAASVLALIVALRSSLSKINDALTAAKALIAGKATKEETEKAISEALNAFKKSYEAERAELKARNDNLTALLSVLAIQIVKSPNARAKIMELVSADTVSEGSVAEVVESAVAEIEAADAAEPKPDTPALDAVRLAVDEDVSTRAAEEYIRLG